MPRIRSTRLVVMALLASPMLACVEAIDLDDGLDTASSQLSPCLAPPTPPPASLTWTLTNQNFVQTLQAPTGVCAAFTLAARNVEKLRVTDSAIATADACIETTISIRKYEKDGSWTYRGSDSATGTWVNPGRCELMVEYRAHASDEARVYVRARRTSCTTTLGGTICGTSNVPFRASAFVFVPDGPN
jgi:hypothetical protein